MAYLAPFISAAGLVIPSYADIQADLMVKYRSVYGQTVYLGTDSSDYQMISIFALKQSDTMQALQLVYNARGPLTAVGSDLDGIIKLNGMARKAASFSTAPGTVGGSAGTTINAGTAIDQFGNSWALPSQVIIPTGGSVVVVLTCETAGSIQAAAGSIAIIGAGATSGWTSISNPSAASPGQPVETDSQLRGRQSFSVAIPSKTMLQGTIAGIAAVASVTRYLVHENFTGAVDADGTPAHSISAVVEGGTDSDIANAIYLNRGIGADMNGTTQVVVTDSDTGAITTVSFSRPTYNQIYVSLSITQLFGYTTAIGDLILSNLLTYLNSLQIGQIVTRSALFAVAMSATDSLITPTFAIESLTLGLAPTPAGTADIGMAYNAVAQSDSTKIILTGG